MHENELLEINTWTLSWLGLDHSFFTITPTTVINTWFVLGLFIVACIPVRFVLRNKWGSGRYVLTQAIETLLDMCQQTLGATFNQRHFSFIAALFIFIAACNIIIVIPWTSEPTQDLNTTLALGLISFFYTQWYAIRQHGIKKYIQEYTTPIFIMFPLHVLGKLASIISISFRLFGNIFGGAIISHMYLQAIQGSIIWETLGLISGTNFLLLAFFGIFEGFLQAFVFMMLSLTYLSIALQTGPEE